MGWLSGWNNRIECVIDNTNVDDALENFPVLLHISSTSGIGDDDLTAFFTELAADANRKKIAVTTDDGETECYVEIERFDYANDVAWLWVKVPAITSGSTTTIYLYYDADQDDNTDFVGDTTDTPAKTVWDSNFVGVWHMAQVPGTIDSIKDSTIYANHGSSGGSMTSADLVDGKVGKGIEFDGINDLINCGNDASLNITGKITLEVLYNSQKRSNWEQMITKNPGYPNEAFGLGYESNGQTVAANFNFVTAGLSSARVIQDIDYSFHYIVGVYDGNYVRLYIDDGGEVDNEHIGLDTIKTTTGDVWIGNRVDGIPCKGPLDEVRISDADRSAAWIKATYYSNWDALITFSEDSFSSESSSSSLSSSSISSSSSSISSSSSSISSSSSSSESSSSSSSSISSSSSSISSSSSSISSSSSSSSSESSSSSSSSISSSSSSSSSESSSSSSESSSSSSSSSESSSSSSESSSSSSESSSSSSESSSSSSSSSESSSSSSISSSSSSLSSSLSSSSSESSSSSSSSCYYNSEPEFYDKTDTTLKTSLLQISTTGEYTNEVELHLWANKDDDEGGVLEDIKLSIACANGLFENQDNSLGQECVTEKWTEVKSNGASGTGIIDDAGASFKAIGGGFTNAADYLSIGNMPTNTMRKIFIKFNVPSAPETTGTVNPRFALQYDVKSSSSSSSLSSSSSSSSAP